LNLQVHRNINQQGSNRMTFTTTALVGNRVLVTGTDFLGTEGKAVLDSSQWVAVNQRKQHKQATKDFDTAVEEFFAPLAEAADKAKAAIEGPVEDPITYVVIDDAVEGTQGRPAHVEKLTRDSVILRILEEDTSTTRLAWVADTLEVLAESQAPAPKPLAPTVAEATKK